MMDDGRNAAKAERTLTLVDLMNQTPYDIVSEFDLINMHARRLWSVEDKYFQPVAEGVTSSLYRFAEESMVHPDDHAVHAELMEPETMLDRLAHSPMPGVLRGNLRYRMMDGSWRWTRQVLIGGPGTGLPEGIVRCYSYDIQSQKDWESGTVSRVPMEAALRDARTGLMTDRDYFPVARERLSRMTGEWCVIAIDIEHFKLFTEWHGQEVADAVLGEVGKVLLRVEKNTGGLAGYHGADDFWLIVPYDPKNIQALFDEIRALIEKHGTSMGFLPIFGICMINKASDDLMEVFNHAALTAEQVKGDFRNRIRLYSPALHERTAQEYRLLGEFQHALENHELFFCLQPQCRVSNGNVVGAESLARWRMPDGRMIPPGVFVPVLEKYGMITRLDQYIWEEVCAWVRKWLDEGHTPVPISVNVSRIDIFTIDVPAVFTALLEKYKLPPKYIKIEITESAYVDDTALVRETVRLLREAGFMVLMDDFGSGYSSLNMLSSLNVDIIKLDAQFLHIGGKTERKGISILESIVSMAKTLSLPVIVEGVETQEQINFLADLGCRYMQGYYFYRPMPVDEFENLIRDEGNIDKRGFEFKANEQIHAREFLDENVFNDAMLNNILGPVAIFCRKDDSVNIVRYNQQYYQMVGIDLDQLNQRRIGIQDYFMAEDRPRFFNMLKRAEEDRLNGAKGSVRVYRPNGTMRWISMQVYYMKHNDQETLFYASCEDVTEQQYINVDVPGSYYRCRIGDGYEFQYTSQNFREMTGYSNEELRRVFDNRLINMVHPDDRATVERRVEELLEQRALPSQPYRLKRKSGGYVYVMNQSRLTDLYGQLSFQAVAIDVSEMMKLRNQMRLLSKYSTDSIIFMHRKAKGGWKHRVVAHGLENRMGLSAKALERMLNDNSFYGMIEGDSVDEVRRGLSESIANCQSFDFECTLALPGREKMRLHMKADHVNEANSKVDYICSLREI